MTALKYLTSPEFGCCTTGEIMQAAKNDKELLPKLKEWARAEMTKKGIEITEA